MRVTFLISILLFSIGVVAQKTEILFIGTYTETGSFGIYVAGFDANTGRLSLLDSAACNNPSYLVQSPDGRYLYAIDELRGPEGGEISSFGFDPLTNKLTFINKQTTGGDHPCFVDIHPKGNWLAVANYTGGSASFLPVDKKGNLAPQAQFIQYAGKGADPKRQEKPHVHQTLFSADGKYVWITDLGLDAVKRYAFKTKKTQPVQEASVLTLGTNPGAGPRHIALHPTKGLVYILTEMEGAISVFSLEKDKASLLQNIKCDTASKQPGSAALFFSPDAKYLYASNRADANTISIFKVDAETGLLRFAGWQSSGGSGPRNFVLHPSGNWLLAANQRSNNVVIFSRNSETGLLSPISDELRLPAPVCLLFAK